MCQTPLVFEVLHDTALYLGIRNRDGSVARSLPSSLGKHVPLVGIDGAFVPGPTTTVQIMVKNSKKFRARQLSVLLAASRESGTSLVATLRSK